MWNQSSNAACMCKERYRGAGGWGANRERQIRSDATLVQEPGYIFD